MIHDQVVIEHPVQQAVLDSIRSDIVQGKYQPGAKLPTRSELESRYAISRVTLQRVFDRLRRDGFVEPRRRHGTFVTSHPPHLTRLGLIFPRRHDGQSEESWPQFWAALESAARERPLAQQGKLATFYGISGPGDIAHYQQIVAQMRAKQLAGLIFVARPDSLMGSPLLTEGDVPRVAIMGDPPIPHLSSVSLDGRRLLERAMDHFVQAGRHRLAVLLPDRGGVEEQRRQVAQVAQERGLEIRPYWMQYASPHSAAGLVQLMMREGQSDYPDAFLITEDNLVPQATLGLAENALAAAGRVEVIAHANFPLVTPAHVPALRLGFDTRDVLEQCISIIIASRTRPGERLRRVIAPLFAHELGESIGAHRPVPGSKM